MQNYLIYLRKSRQDNPQETVEEVLARHETQLQEYSVKTFGYRIEEENIYREVVSGETIEDRPQINLLFERLQRENIEGVLVVEPSRLTRGDMLDCGTVVHLFKYSDTLIVTPQKTYNLKDKFDRKFFEMELSRGNDYLEYTKEILARGRSSSAHEGNYIGGVAPYGYDRIKIGKSPTLKINEREAKAVRLIFDMYLNEGIGYYEIANRINAMGFVGKKGNAFIGKVINDILHNPVYIGKIKFQHRKEVKIYENGRLKKKRITNNNCELIDGKHEAIITIEQFQAVQDRKGKNVKLSPNKELTNVYSGILKCAKCGRSIGRKSDKTPKHDRYFCRNRQCSNVSERTDVIDNVIVNALKQSLDDFETQITDDNHKIVENHRAIIAELERDLDKIEQKQEQLYEFLENGVYSKEVFLNRNSVLDVERQKTKKAIEEAKSTMPTIEDYKLKVVSLHQAIDMLQDDSISALAKNTFLKTFVKAIYYEKNDRANKWKKETGFKITIELL